MNLRILHYAMGLSIVGKLQYVRFVKYCKVEGEGELRSKKLALHHLSHVGNRRPSTGKARICTRSFLPVRTLISRRPRLKIIEIAPV
jgi:hypothetical protein